MINDYENDEEAGIAILNMLLILAFIALILGGYSISSESKQNTSKALTVEEKISSLETNSTIASKTSTIVAGLDESHIGGHTFPIANQVQVSANNKTARNQFSDDETMLGIFLVIIKNR